MDNNLIYVFRNKVDNNKEVIIKLFIIYVQLRLEEENKKTKL